MAKPTVDGGRERKTLKRVFVSESEAKRIDALVKKNGEASFSDYARRVLTNESNTTPVLAEHVVPREVMRELHAIGNNINQIAHNTNIHDAATREDIYQAAELVHDLTRVLQPLRVQLTGQYDRRPTCKQELT